MLKGRGFDSGLFYSQIQFKYLLTNRMIYATMYHRSELAQMMFEKFTPVVVSS